MRKLLNMQVPKKTLFIFGFLVGLAIMSTAVNVFHVNQFDFENMLRGERLLLAGINPWAEQYRIPHFYNPPFSVFFLWVLLFSTPKVLLITGGSLIFAFLFYHKYWTAFSWFLTSTFLWVLGAGGIDMFVIGAGLVLLLASDSIHNKTIQAIFRTLAYGLLMIKPQGGLFITVFYILRRKDWVGFTASVCIYGLILVTYYPAWLHVLMTDPPLAQTEASHSLAASFGIWVSLIIALFVLFSRNWKYWQIGGALAGILAPYGMPGLPILLVLTAINKPAVFPVFILYSAFLTVLTWVAPQSPLMGIYHLSMLALALILACLLPSSEKDDADTIHTYDFLKSISTKVFERVTA